MKRRDLTYREALKYLESFQRFGIRLGLGNIRRLLILLGNPEKRLKVLHIGGTNGKGSVGAFLFYILKEAGYKVGLYTSPHLIDFRERIRTTQGLISKRELAGLTQVISSLIPSPTASYGSGKLQITPYHRLLRATGQTSNNLERKLKRKNQIPGSRIKDQGLRIKDPDFHPTFFEVTTALALKYFAEQGVDFAILEVGMGGRLDATNVTKPLVSVITNVDFEHTEHLGKSLKKIAYEKCGIIKEGISVVTAEDKKEVLRIIEETCRKKKARLYRVGKEVIVTSHPVSQLSVRRTDGQTDRRTDALLTWQTFNVQGIYGEYENLRISLLGRHQLLNAACAIGAVELLRPQISITKGQIREGLARTKWLGRIEVFRLKRSKQKLSSYPRKVPSEQRGRQAIEIGKPANRKTGKLVTIILDGMHNVAGARALREAIRDSFDYKELILVLGILKDKDIKGILAQLGPLASQIIITRPQTRRAAEPGEVTRMAREYSRSVVIKEKISQAIRYALICAGSEDIILITGSLYTVGEAIKAL